MANPLESLRVMLRDWLNGPSAEEIAAQLASDAEWARKYAEGRDPASLIRAQFEAACMEREDWN